ncbi:MAG: hypothetical protein ABFC84_13585 [Veillonellales bacterium]
MNSKLLPPKPVWLAFVLHTGIVFAAAALADFFPRHEPAGFVNSFLAVGSPFIDKWIRWDAHWYTYVAQFGYNSQSIVFFPVIVLLIKILAWSGLSTAAAGFLLCNLFAGFSFWLLYAVFRLDFSAEQSRRALLAYGLFPTSFCLNSIYTEPLFLVFSLACAYCSRTGRWYQAGFFAMFAALTRNLGICLVGLIFLEGWKARPRRQSFLAALLLPFLALSCFSLYNWQLTGDPLAFVHAQQSWGRYFSYPWISYWRNISLLGADFFAQEPGILLDALLVLFTFGGLMRLTLAKKIQIRQSYLLIAWLWFLLPLCSSSEGFPLYSMSRFVFVLFPLYLAWVPVPTAYYTAGMLISALLLFVCTLLFVNWYWIG